MEKIFKNSSLFISGMAILVLSSCTLPDSKVKGPGSFDPVAIKTIALFPITYDQAYAPPLPTDLSGTDLSTRIRLQIEKNLAGKGYVVKPTAFPSGKGTYENSDPLKIDPLILVRSSPLETDGLMQVHVTFHFGINPTQRSSDEGPFSEIFLNATGRLIEKASAAEVWRGNGRARPIKSADFSTRLNYAVYTLVQGLLKTFPGR